MNETDGAAPDGSPDVADTSPDDPPDAARNSGVEDARPAPDARPTRDAGTRTDGGIGPPPPVAACGQPRVPIPMGRWDMDSEVDGFVANSGWGGALTLDLAGAELGPGMIGQAIQLDGSPSAEPHIPDHQMFRRLHQGTISVRVYVATTELADGEYAGIVSKDAVGQRSNHLTLKEKGGRAELRIQESASGDQRELSGAEFPGDQWHHMVATWREGEAKLFLDGEAWSTDEGWSIAENREPIGIGFSTENSDDGSLEPTEGFLSGQIDEIAIWDEVLANDVITALGGEDCSIPAAE